MLVHGAFVPPRVALEELVDVVRSVRREPVAAPAEKRRLLRRRSADEAAEPSGPVLVDVPVDALRLPITAFGNLTAHDARRLVAALTDAAETWERPTVHFSGGGALESPGDAAVWARLAGDVDALAGIAAAVTRCVESLGLFVDRRIFKPALAVATVTESTTGPDLDAVVGALQELQGQPWEVDSVVLTVDPAGRGAVEEYERIPIG